MNISDLVIPVLILGVIAFSLFRKRPVYSDFTNQILKQVGDELMKDENWQTSLLGIELWGIDSFSENTVMLKVKLTTKSGEQWLVSREFRRRVKKAFDARNRTNPIFQNKKDVYSPTKE